MPLSVLQRVEEARALYGYGQSAQESCARYWPGDGQKSLSAAVVGAQLIDGIDPGMLGLALADRAKRVEADPGLCRDGPQVLLTPSTKAGENVIKGHGDSLAHNWAACKPPIGWDRPIFPNCPTDGRLGTISRVPATLKTLAENVRALMTYALDHQTGEPTSSNGLAAATGLGRGTIQRVVRGGPNAPAIDTLSIIASAYKLQAWQLLVPGLDPSNPPVILVTDAERQLQERLRLVSREFAKHLDREKREAGAGRGPSPDPARPAKVPRRKTPSK